MSGSKSSDVFSARAPSPPSEPAGDHVLGLTVHSMPQAAGAVAYAERTRHGRWKLLLLLLVCAAPVVASYFTYYVIRPEARRNYGELVQPQRPLPALPTTTLDGRPGGLLSALKGQWLLVSVSGGACSAACEQHLYLQRQLRESMGAGKDRIDWVWLIDDDAPVPAALLPALRQATVLRVDAKALAAWLQPAPGQQLVDHLYLVDPMGNWMMRFPAGLDRAGAAKAKRDLERLLRASASWDEPGRAEQH